MKPDYAIRIADIAAEIVKMRERQLAREGPTGYEPMTNELLLDFYLIETPQERRSIRREILSRMTKP